MLLLTHAILQSTVRFRKTNAYMRETRVSRSKFLFRDIVCPLQQLLGLLISTEIAESVAEVAQRYSDVDMIGAVRPLRIESARSSSSFCFW